MKEINDSNGLDDLGLTPASELTEITLKPDQYFELQFQNLINQIMQEMHRTAAQAKTTYVAPISGGENGEAQMVEKITETLKGLGYEVSSQKDDDRYTMVTIKWNSPE